MNPERTNHALQRTGFADAGSFGQNATVSKGAAPLSCPDPGGTTRWRD
jgi:hypothetical protein